MDRCLQAGADLFIRKEKSRNPVGSSLWDSIRPPPQPLALALALEAFPGSWTALWDSIRPPPQPLALALEAFPGSR